MPTTPRWTLRYPALSSTPDVPLDIHNLASDLDGVAMDDQGLLSARPVSTVGTPGKKGRYYKATDTGQLFRDNGTGWDAIPIGAGGVTSELLADAARLGVTDGATVRRGKSIIATEESRTNASYGLMTTPDRVQSIVLPTDGLIAVAFQGIWKESVAGAGRASIFVGANQLKIAHDGTGGGGPSGSGAAHTAAGVLNTYSPLASAPFGLVSSQAARDYGVDVTTGQAVGMVGIIDGLTTDIAGVETFTRAAVGGPCYIFAVAGTYDVSVQFKASSGSVTVKNRKLWVWTMGF
jgi:hypothetical protein